MDPWLIALVIALIGVIFHGIFTGLALVATWYFGRMAELKLLSEAQAIHKEITDKIAKMEADEKDYDKIDAFLEDQKKIMTGYRSEITRGIGEVIDERLRQVAPAAQGTAAKQSAVDRLLGIGEAFAMSALQAAE